ncbi:SatD family protein [Geminisphaera colitermitum]|uniref:SatD family protein n=1 Tax=Geminisphaera colitermitum TaxID=1148786 RepID=UPI00019654B5|nr:SatD family protein [Geminisphaera colitermitum]
MSYIVVIGDVIQSRAIQSRGTFQERLKGVLKEEARVSKKLLASPHTLTLGDEFQAVYQRAEGLFAGLFRIKARCHPVRIRFSIAWGEITTAINRKQALEMDGPAFHLAREGMELLKRSGGGVGLAGELPGGSDLRSALVDILAGVMDDWLPNRLEILCGLLEDREIKEMAERLSVSESAVYKNIRRGRLESWRRVIAGLEGELAERMEKTGGAGNKGEIRV